MASDFQYKSSYLNEFFVFQDLFEVEFVNMDRLTFFFLKKSEVVGSADNIKVEVVI